MESLAQQTRAQSLIILAASQSRTSSSLSSIRLSVVSLTETRNSSQTHIAKSFSRQRTTPCWERHSTSAPTHDCPS